MTEDAPGVQFPHKLALLDGKHRERVAIPGGKPLEQGDLAVGENSQAVLHRWRGCLVRLSETQAICAEPVKLHVQQAIVAAAEAQLIDAPRVLQFRPQIVRVDVSDIDETKCGKRLE